MLNADQRRIIGFVRQITLLIIALTLAVIWFPQIQHSALSITAIAVAVVVASKELMNTVIQEIDPGRYSTTGRTVSLPNSLFLTSNGNNQNFLRRY